MSELASPDSVFAHFAGIVLAATLGAIQGRSDRIGPFWMVLVRLPGTLLHELAHLVVVFITGGKPAGFTIIPRRTVGVTIDGSARKVWVLGSVTITNPSILAAFPSGFAPLLLLPVAWFLYRGWFVWFPPDLPHTLLMYVAVVVCCGSSLPSAQDAAVALSRPLGVILYAAVGAGAWFLWNTLRG
jgi:hypothetical protein